MAKETNLQENIIEYNKAKFKEEQKQGTLGRKGRIVYVEPNDFSGHFADGTPVMPDYSDYCISFDLCAEVVSRKSVSGVGGVSSEDKQTKTAVLSWTTPLNRDKSEFKNILTEDNFVSFMSGMEADRYLSTYYTDVSPVDIRQRNIVEGIGITDVNISYQNYYMPVIKMKMVDVRGSAMFGREEATHENEKIVRDNIYGCFFTQPYPKFRMQIKGFYGQAVTFQLSCSEFKGRFNSQNGNYEVDITFMGYDFGLISEIPMSCLMAAPYSGYGGRAYWDSKVNSPEWRLSNEKRPMKLKELCENIESANDNGFNGNYLMKTEVMESSLRHKANLAELKKVHDDVISALGRKTYTYRENDKAQYLFAIDENFSFPKFEAKLNKFYEVLKKYVDNYPSDGVSSLKDDRSVGGQGELYTVDSNVGSYTEYRKKDYPVESTTNNSEDESLQVVITNILGGDTKKIKKKYLAYCFMNIGTEEEKRYHIGYFNDGEFNATYNKDINKVSNTINDEKERIKEEAKKNRDDDNVAIARILGGGDPDRGFIPYIGDVFKIIACHMETFMYMMERCNDKINSQRLNNDRTPEKLGVPYSYTFGDTDRNVPAFPKVASPNRPNPSDDPNGGGYENVIGWVGDYQGDIEWEEEKLVNALVHGAQKDEVNTEDIEYKTPENTVKFIPVLPIDLKNGRADLSGTRGTEDSVAFYLGLRAAQVFGAFDTDEQIPTKVINSIAKADAINYYNLFGSRLNTKDKVFKPFGSSAYRDRVKEMLTCSKNGGNDDHYDFEIAKGLKIHGGKYKRQPMYKYTDGKMEYCYTPYSSNITSIPAYVDDYRDINKIYTYKRGANGGFYEKKIKSRTLETNVAYDNARNASEFFITTDKTELQLFDSVYTTVTGSEFVVGGKKFDSSDIGNTFVEGTWSKLNENACRFDVISKRSYGSDSSTYPKYAKYNDFEHGFVTEDKKVYFNGELMASVGRQGYVLNVPSCFGDPMYYVQNIMENPDYRKAYIFLSDAIGENIKNIVKSLCVEKMGDNAQKHGCISELPYLYTVYLGAVIWRREFNKLNEKEFLANLDDRHMVNLCEDESTVYRLEDGTLTAALQKENNKAEYCTYDDVFGKLIFEKNQCEAYKERFEEFVNRYWPQIRKGFELLKSDGSLVDPETIYSYQKEIESFDRISSSHVNRLVLSDENYKKAVTDRFQNYFDIYDTYGEKNLTGNAPKHNNTSLQDALYTLYTSSCIIGNTAAYSSKTDNHCYIKESDFNQYADTFFNTLTAICVTDESYSTSVTRRNGTKNTYTQDERDERCAVYLMLKQLYDRWLFINNGVEVEVTDRDGKVKKVPWYSVEGYFETNFRFIDQFYTNIYSRLHINCNILYNILMSDQDKGSEHGKFLMSVMSQLTTKHNCHFFAFPNYLMMRANNNLEEYMKDIFTPIPYSKKANIEASNRFIIMYTYKPSENASNLNDEEYDGFDIWTEKHEGSILPTFMNTSSNNADNTTLSEGEEQAQKRGFDIPSFGVAAMRQNNAIFKDIDVSMHNPVVTEQVINAMARIMERGNGGDRTVAFYGQDIYPIYTGNSYTCTLKMMGNAQIMPLMYFQLTNVPMFRGTYMIYSVQHQMSPGDMTTTVSAMKMSKFAYPYSEGWWMTPDVIFIDDDSEKIQVEQDINPEEVNVDSDEGGDRASDLKYSGGSPNVRTRHVKCEPTVFENSINLTNAYQGRYWNVERGSVTLSKAQNADLTTKCCFVTNDEGMHRNGANKDNELTVGRFIRKLTVTVRDLNGNDRDVDLYVNMNLVKDIKEIFAEIYNTRLDNGEYLRLQTAYSTRPMPYVDENEHLVYGNLPYNTLYCFSHRDAQTSGGNSTGSLSMHSYGCAIDLNPHWNQYNNSESNKEKLLTKGKYNPQYNFYHGHPVVEIFKNHGWGWGGYYGDPMHFSFISYTNDDYLVGI